MRFKTTVSMFVLLLEACIPPPEVDADLTREVCAVEPAPEVTTLHFEPFEPSDACRNQILRDFRVRELTLRAEQALLDGAYGLLVLPWAVDESLDLYEWTTVFKMSVQGSTHLAYRRRNAALVVPDNLSTPLVTAMGLAHEAHHHRGSRHVECSWGEGQCDNTPDGAYSWNVELADGLSTSDPYVQEVLNQYINLFEAHIEIE